MSAESTVPSPAGPSRTAESPAPVAVVRPRVALRGLRPPPGPRRAVRHASPLPLLAVDTAAALLGIAALAAAARAGALGWRAAASTASAAAHAWPTSAHGWPVAAHDWPAAWFGWSAVAAVWPTVVLLLTVLTLHARAGLYGTRTVPPLPGAPLVLDELPALCGRITAGWVMLAALLAGLSPDRALPLPALLAGCAVHAAASCAGRAAVHARRRLRAARHPCPTLVIGPPAGAQRVAAALLRHPACGLRPVGVAVPGTDTARPEPGVTHPDPVPGGRSPAAGGLTAPDAGAPGTGTGPEPGTGAGGGTVRTVSGTAPVSASATSASVMSVSATSASTMSGSVSAMATSVSAASSTLTSAVSSATSPVPTSGLAPASAGSPASSVSAPVSPSLSSPISPSLSASISSPVSTSISSPVSTSISPSISASVTSQVPDSEPASVTSQVPVPAAAPASGETDLPVLCALPDVRRALIQNTVGAALFVGTEGAPGPLMGVLTEYHCLVWRLEPEPAAALPGPGPEQAAGRAAVAAAVPGGLAGRARRGGPQPRGRSHLAGFPCTPVWPLRPPRPSLAKRALDVTVSGLLLVLAGPLLATCAAALRLIEGPGVLFRQERVGKGGRPFTLLKFRTYPPADAQEASTRWSIAGDQRMSSFCRFLRRTSLDELPQLWNVFRGDMSLVGPRPERPHFVAKFSRMHPGYAARHRMPSGITGLAQIHGLRGDTSIEDRCRFDNAYIDTWSFWQDVCILVRTAVMLVRPTGS